MRVLLQNFSQMASAVAHSPFPLCFPSLQICPAHLVRDLAPLSWQLQSFHAMTVLCRWTQFELRRLLQQQTFYLRRTCGMTRFNSSATSPRFGRKSFLIGLTGSLPTSTKRLRFKNSRCSLREV